MRKLRISTVLLFFATMVFAGVAPAGDLIANHVRVHKFDHGQEEQLLQALQRLRNNELDGALDQLRQLVSDNPKFRLAQLIYADLLLAKASPIRDFGSLPSASYQQILSLKEEARARWQHHSSPPPDDRIPDSLVKLSPGQKHVILVNLSTSRLYLYENRDGIPHLVSDFYATIGKNGIGKVTEGDQKTPVGVYFVTDFIDPGELPDLYGDGAFPIDYPNAWDQRYGRTGYGIWLHGTPSNTFSRPPRDSDGCVILSNRDFNTIAGMVEPGRTPMILTENIEWLAVDEWRTRQDRLQMLIEQWRSDWESRNADLYLSHYSPDYSGLGKDYEEWIDYKRRVNSSKRFIRVGISGESIFFYPGEEKVLVVTFVQDYASDNYRREFVKRQYWKLEEDGRWRIVYEGSVS